MFETNEDVSTDLPLVLLNGPGLLGVTGSV